MREGIFMAGKESVGFGIAFGVVALVFMVLRLCGVVSWSWLWVLSPLWIYGILFACVWLYLIVEFVKILLRR